MRRLSRRDDGEYRRGQEQDAKDEKDRHERIAQPALCLDMRAACGHADDMPRMIQIRNVPDALHRKIKARAAQSGMTLSDYLLAELERTAALPTREEMLARLHSRRRVTLKTPAAEIIRRERESA
jgi:plasmid stability protein